jgi:DNA-binding LytR/AlgR family response regulator
VFLGGYALLNVNLYLNYRDNLFHERADNVKKNKIEASDPDGKTVVNLDDVISFERIGRNNVVNIPGQQLRIKYSLNELEQILNGDKFLRINRSTIINLSSFKNYSFWENDKYILRLQNGKEYTVSRERMKNLKNKLL